MGDMHRTGSGTDGRTVRLLYASQSSFGGIKTGVTGLDKHFFQRTIVNIVLPIIVSICFGCSKKSGSLRSVLLSTHNICFG